jgi:hypothetical protein
MENPFVNVHNNVIKFKADVYFRTKDNDIVLTESKVWNYATPSEEFIRIYNFSKNSQFKDLTKSELAIIFHIFTTIKANVDIVRLNKKEIVDEKIVSVGSFPNAISGLIKKEVIAKHVDKDKYFINPHFIWKGNYTKKYLKTPYSVTSTRIYIKDIEIINKLLKFDSNVNKKIAKILASRYDKGTLRGYFYYTINGVSYNIGDFAQIGGKFTYSIKHEFMDIVDKYFIDRVILIKSVNIEFNNELEKLKLYK